MHGSSVESQTIARIADLLKAIVEDPDGAWKANANLAKVKIEDKESEKDTMRRMIAEEAAIREMYRSREVRVIHVKDGKFHGPRLEYRVYYWRKKRKRRRAIRNFKAYVILMARKKRLKVSRRRLTPEARAWFEKAKAKAMRSYIKHGSVETLTK